MPIIKNQHGFFETKAKNGAPKKTKSGVKINNQTGKAETGRPSVMTSAKIKKLEEAFSMGCSDLEACLHAGISAPPLYAYQQQNPEFVNRKELLRETTILLARNEVIKGLKNNAELSLKYLERKRKSEFSLRTELTGKDGEAVQTATTINIITK